MYFRGTSARISGGVGFFGLSSIAHPPVESAQSVTQCVLAGPESILNPTENVPLLEVATKTAFVVLAEDPDREIVLVTAVMVPPGFRASRRPLPEDFRTIEQPGFAIAIINFLAEDDGAGACLISTETRVRATDPSAKRRFASYWRMIYPGSALIRRMWLRAIKKRAEVSAP